MFKHYITYQFILSFDRDCRVIELPPADKKCVSESIEKAVETFKKSIQAEDIKEELRWVFVSLMYLQDVRDLLKKNSIANEDVWARFKVIEQRLFQIGTQLREKQEGQMRLIG